MFNKNTISLDIGTYNTKIVIGNNKKKNKDLTIEKAYTLKTPKGAYENGYIKDMESMKSLLYSFLVDNKIKDKDIICSVKSSKVITREIVLPKVKEKELKSMIHIEIEQYLPIRLNEYSVEYKVIEEFEEQGNKSIRVLVGAIPKDMVESYLKLIQSLKLKPVALDIHSNGISKIFENDLVINKENHSLNKTVAAIDIGHGHMNVTIIKNGVMRFNRLVDKGACDLDTSIANSFNLTIEEANERKHNNLTLLNNGESNSLIFENIKPTIDSFISEIQKIFRFYESRDRHNKIDEIYLYGATTKIKGLDSLIEEALNVPTISINTMDKIKYAKDVSLNLSEYLNSISALIRR